GRAMPAPSPSAPPQGNGDWIRHASSLLRTHRSAPIRRIAEFSPNGARRQTKLIRPVKLSTHCRRAGTTTCQARRRKPSSRSLTMPLVRIDLIRGKSAQYRKTLGDIIYKAMIDVINVPENDKFQIITEHAPEELNLAESYLGNRYSNDVILIQITLTFGRSIE